jgi:cardiolipin synthase
LVNIPNLITLGRLVLVPTIVWLLIGNYYVTTFWLFVAAGISDAIDGFLARQFNAATELGAYLDPLADKALLVSIYVVLAVKAELPVWLAVMVVSRDVLIVGAFLLAWVINRPIDVRPLWISKANTFAQIVLAAVALADLAHRYDLNQIRVALIAIVAILTVSSAGAYLVGWMRHTARP